MEKSEIYKEKRRKLAELTAHFRSLRQNKINTAKTLGDAAYWMSRTLNSFIVELYQEQAGEGEFKTFRQWREKNRTIKKGEKGWPIWGQPLGSREEDEEPEGDGVLYFPLCYLFHESQTVSPKAIEQGTEPRARAELVDIM